MRHTSLLSLLGFALLAGCAAAPTTQTSCGKITGPQDDPNAMPADVLELLTAHHWGHMHLDFHVARQWDVLDSDSREWATKQKISRWKLQEGQATSGLEFLAMHRLMLQELRGRFPDHADLFAGWKTPPTDQPAAASTFDPDMVKAIDRLQNDLGSFATDDDFALFLQTKRRPTADDPRARASDPEAGIHNYLHVRWTSDSPINVGDPAVNLENQIFWRIHGWIDARWTAYRQAKGLDDASDPAYQAAMHDAQVWMDDAMTRAMSGGDKADDGCETEPPAVQNIFSE